MAYQLGDFVDVEEKYLLEPSKYLRIKVDVDKTRPLNKENVYQGSRNAEVNKSEVFSAMCVWDVLSMMIVSQRMFYVKIRGYANQEKEERK